MKENIEAIYGLSPAQEVLLLRSIRDGTSDDVGFQQLELKVRGTLDPERFKAAWTAVADRHATLRTSFHWQEMSRPVQVVHRDVRPGIEFVDLRFSSDDCEDRLKQIASADRHRGFDLSAAPLFRVNVIRTGDQEYRILWAVHHLIADGWSSSVIVREVMSNYNRNSNQDPSTPAVAYRQYIDWLAHRTIDDDRRFWQDQLAGFVPAPSLLIPRAEKCDDDATRPSHAVNLSLGEGSGRKVQEAARRLQISVATLTTAAWALALSRALHREDVLFGMALSGRPPQLPGAELAVGLYSNTVPVRLQFEPETKTSSWLTQLNQNLASVSRHQYVAPSQLQSTAPTPLAHLYESVLVVQNFPGFARDTRSDQPLEILSARGGVASAYPLTVAVRFVDAVEIETFCSQAHGPVADDLASALRSALEILCSTGDRTIRDTLGLISWNDDLSLPQPSLPTHQSIPPAASEPPRGEVEIVLARIWKDVLGVEVGRDDDFFEMGGSSVDAVGLFKVIGDTFGKNLPLATLFKAPTIRLVAKLLTDASKPADFEFMRTIRDGSGLGPLICIHGQGGEIIYFRELAVSLDDRRPCYGFEAKGLDGSAPHESVEEMATAYLSELEQVYESGAINLISVCGGSHIAFEIACRLNEAQGSDVFLFLVDPAWLRPDERTAVDHPSTANRTVIQSVLRLLPKLRGILFSRLRRGLGFIAREWGYRSMDAGQRNVARAVRRAYHSYSPRTLDGKIVILLSKTWQTERPNLAAELQRWQQLVSEPVDVHRLDTEHHEILLAPELSKIVNDYLEHRA